MARHAVFLGTYIMYVTPFRNSERMRLNDLDGNGSKFLDWAADFLADKQTFHNAGSEADLMRYRTADYQEEPGGVIYGRIACGEVGIGEDIVDGETGVSGGVKRASEAGMVPHYFQISAPADTKYAVLALSRLGVKGAYGYFNGPFADAFRETFPEFSLHIEPAIAPDVLEALRTAPVRSVEFSSAHPRSDAFSKIVHDADPKALVFRASVSARRGRSVRLKQNLSSMFDALSRADVVEMPEEWKALGDRAAITLRVRGKRDRTITVGIGRDIVPYEELRAEQDDYDDRGWPKLAFLHTNASTMVAQVRRRNGG